MTPRSRNQPERAIEDRFFAWLASQDGIKDIERQVRIDRRSRADILFYAEIDGPMVGVVECKARHTTSDVLWQVIRYLQALRDRFDHINPDVTYVTFLVAPSFSLDLQRYAKSSDSLWLFEVPA
jgi:hypothetical protein